MGAISYVVPFRTAFRSARNNILKPVRHPIRKYIFKPVRRLIRTNIFKPVRRPIRTNIFKPVRRPMRTNIFVLFCSITSLRPLRFQTKIGS